MIVLLLVIPNQSEEGGIFRSPVDIVGIKNTGLSERLKMAVTLDDTKRNAIASKLADMKAIQELLISAEQQLMSEINDEESKMTSEDARI